MNETIARYFDDIEARLIASPAISSYRVLRREIAPADGKLRVKATLNNGIDQLVGMSNVNWRYDLQ